MRFKVPRDPDSAAEKYATLPMFNMAVDIKAREVDADPRCWIWNHRGQEFEVPDEHIGFVPYEDEPGEKPNIV